MNSQELRALQEAYSQVYELDEVSNAKVAAVSKARQKNVDKAFDKLDDSRGSSQNLATAVSKLQKNQRLSAKRDKRNEAVDLYDIILSHLLDEGYADTQEAAEAIMVNMSEDWRESIMEKREHDEPGEEDGNPDVRSHNRAVGYKSKPKQKYGSYDKRDRGGSEEDHEKALGLQNLIRSVQGGSVKKSV